MLEYWPYILISIGLIAAISLVESWRHRHVLRCAFCQEGMSHREAEKLIESRLETLGQARRSAASSKDTVLFQKLLQETGWIVWPTSGESSNASPPGDLIQVASTWAWHNLILAPGPQSKGGQD